MHPTFLSVLKPSSPALSLSVSHSLSISHLQLNIHRFKVIARFGLMHVVATNICVWIRTLVKESLLEITIYHQKREADPDASSIAHSIRQHALRHAGTVLRTHAGPNSEFEVLDGEDVLPKNVYKSDNVLSKLVRNTVDGISKSLGMGGGDVATSSSTTTTTTTTTRAPYTTPGYQWHSTTMARKLKKFITSTTAATSTVGSSSSPSTVSTSSTASSGIGGYPINNSGSAGTTGSSFFNTAATAADLSSSSTTSETPFNSFQRILSSVAPSLTPVDVAAPTLPAAAEGNAALATATSGVSSFLNSLASSTPSTGISGSTPVSSTESAINVMNNLFGPGIENSFQTYSDLSHDDANGGLVAFENLESLDNIYPAALSSNIGTLNSTACGRIDIMGTIVYDSAPYLYPFIIEYSLIGAVVLYVMWKHIGRYPGRLNDEDLEHRLEVMLSRRAVAMAQQARSGRVDCVGSSKGLFFGLLLLVGALICLILFFVLVRHQQFSLLAIYLADASHCVLMAFAILAIIIGFIRCVRHTIPLLLMFSGLIHLFHSQGKEPEVPLRGAIESERHLATHLSLWPVHLLRVQHHCRQPEGARERAQSTGDDHRRRCRLPGDPAAALHCRCIASSCPLAGARSQQARTPDCHLPSHLQRGHVRHLHIRSSKSIRQSCK